MPRVDYLLPLLSNNFFRCIKYYNVGDLFVQWPVQFQKTRKEDVQRRRMIALP